jgi:hypothetical protein
LTLSLLQVSCYTNKKASGHEPIGAKFNANIPRKYDVKYLVFVAQEHKLMAFSDSAALIISVKAVSSKTERFGFK